MGQIHTLWLGRFISIIFLLTIFLFRQKKPSIPIRWWPFLFIQGLLDAGGYISLFAVGLGEGKEAITIIASTFGGVTVILARIFIKEKIRLIQWVGILLILAGVATL